MLKVSTVLSQVRAELTEPVEKEWSNSELLVYANHGLAVVWGKLADVLPQLVWAEAHIGFPAGTFRFPGLANVARVLSARSLPDTVARSVSGEFVSGATWTAGPDGVFVKECVVPGGESRTWVGADGVFYQRDDSTLAWLAQPSTPSWASTAMSEYAAWWGSALRAGSYTNPLLVVLEDSATSVSGSATSGGISSLSISGVSDVDVFPIPDVDTRVFVRYIPSAPTLVYDDATSTDSDVPLPDDMTWLLREWVLMRAYNRNEAIPQLEAKFARDAEASAVKLAEVRIPRLLTCSGGW